MSERLGRLSGRLPGALRSAGLFALPLIVGGATGAATAGSIRTWYRGLEKPGFTPPDAVFGPVWTALYATMGASLVMVRGSGRGRDARREVDRATVAFATQLALNAGWSLVFFRGRAPGPAFGVIVALWLAILATIGTSARVRPAAGAILVPYLAWVTFAAALNAEVWRLND